MRVIHEPGEMAAESLAWLRSGRETGFIPTMGALHAGHLSLADRARADNDMVAMSIFVNPAQFMPGEDFDAYPRTLDADLEAAENAGVDAVFVPTAAAMYRPRAQTAVMVDSLTKPLCGLSRGRGHFTGVATVVAKLFNLVRPTRAYFGQKDAQQALVVQRMVLDLDFPVEIVVCPTAREDDGLALSSRNRNLPAGSRASALRLREALVLGRDRLRKGERDAMALLEAMTEWLVADPAVEIDYLNIAAPETLEDVERVDDLALFAGAVRVGGVRLIDNLLAGPDGPWED